MSTLRLNRRALAAALSRLSTTAPRKSPKAALTCARFDFAERLTITATDCERVQSERLTVDEATGAVEPFTANVAEFAAAVRLSKAADCQLTVEAGAVRVDGCKLSQAEPVEDFPASFKSHDVDGESYVANGGAVIDAAELRRLVTLAEFATDKESSRYALGGCLLEVQREAIGAYLGVIGTDGRRLSAFATIDAAEPAEFASAVVPVDALRLVAKQLAKQPAGAVVLVELLNRKPSNAEPSTEPASEAEPARQWNNHCDFARFGIFDRLGELVAMTSTRCIDGRFPNWRQVVKPSEPAGALLGSIVVSELEAAAKRAELSTCDDSRGVTFAVRGSAAFVYNRGLNGSRSFARLAVHNAPTAAKNSRRLMFDVRFLVDFAKAAKAAGVERVELWNQSESAPMELRAAGVHVLMPMARQRRRAATAAG